MIQFNHSTTGQILLSFLFVISVLVPAHNEEKWLGGCLDSIDAAARNVDQDVETIVCLNRCTDRTEAIACERGAVIAREDARNLSKIRNAAARQASGEIFVTIDADSRMSPNTLLEIHPSYGKRFRELTRRWPIRFGIRRNEESRKSGTEPFKMTQ